MVKEYNWLLKVILWLLYLCHTCPPAHLPHTHTKQIKCNYTRSWSDDGSEVKSTYCSFKGPRFGCQHLHGRSQPSVTLVLGDTIPSSHLQRHRVPTNMWGKAHTHKSFLRIKMQKPGMVVHTFNPSTWEAVAGGFLSSILVSLFEYGSDGSLSRDFRNRFSAKYPTHTKLWSLKS